MLDMTPIKERIQCSTPGLWTWDHKGANEIMLPVDDGQPVGTLLMGEDKYGFALNFGYVTDEGDAELITHAREDLVALVAEVERLREENESLRKELSDTEEELDDLYRTNPFYKEKPDA